MVEQIIHPAALAELAEAAAFYEERAPDLGRDLFEEVVRVLGLIAENPDVAPVFDDPYRRLLAGDFRSASYIDGCRTALAF